MNETPESNLPPALEPSRLPEPELATPEPTDETTAHAAPPEPATTAAPDSSAPSPTPTFVHRVPRKGLIGPFGGRQLLGGLLVVALVAVGLAAVTAPIGSARTSTQPDPKPTPYQIGPVAEGLHVGDQAPDFSVTRSDGTTFQLTDLSGKPVKLADLRGKAVWVNFWASWCPPCQAETPVLREMDQTYASRGLAIVGISVQEASAADVAAYAQKYSLGYRIAADLGGDIFHKYKVYALPTQFFIDTNGRIAAVVQGPMDQADASAQIEALLPKS